MATATHIPLEQYLSTDYEPDAEYVDGEIEERNAGEYEHNLAQLALVNWFNEHGSEWKIRSIQEQHTRLTPTRYRIPDVCVFSRGLLRESIFTHPQIVAIEVLSPEDKHSRIQERIEDFINFGVRNIWVIDPIKRIGWNCSDGNWIRQERFEVPGTPIYISLGDLFRKIDEEEKD
ncbi:MAG TPA: Uma2 family endonuclease [Silvibacterium sp.]|jgi:Uma2 family endonuclease|nr:Uma2 family endonuclease [Silvibacterium sp.]